MEKNLLEFSVNPQQVKDYITSIKTYLETNNVDEETAKRVGSVLSFFFEAYMNTPSFVQGEFRSTIIEDLDYVSKLSPKPVKIQEALSIILAYLKYRLAEMSDKYSKLSVKFEQVADTLENES